MESFLNEQVIQSREKRARRAVFLLAGLAAAGIVLFAALCLATRTGNARAMLYAAWGVLIPLGWACLAVWMFYAEPARAEVRHLRGLAEGEADMLEGRFTLDAEGFRIPRSVRVRKVRLDTGEEIRSLNLNETLCGRMPPDGSLVRVKTVHKFVTGMEVLEEAPVEARGTEPRLGKRAARAAARIFPAAFLWAMMIPILTGFVFTRLTDTDPAHKIVIYADCAVTDGAGLAERLEKELGGAVRMVKVHPFTYALFGTEQMKTADLYVVPDSDREDYIDWFEPLPGTPEDGIPVFDPASGLSVAEAYFRYTPEGAEPVGYRLYFGAGSPHREDGLAIQAAELLCAMTNE